MDIPTAVEIFREFEKYKNNKTPDYSKTIEMISRSTKENLDYIFKRSDNCVLNFGIHKRSLIHVFVQYQKYCLVEALLKKKVEVNEPEDNPTGGFHPLEWALLHKNDMMIRILITNGADPHLCYYHSIFHHAHRPEIEKIILDHNLSTGKRYIWGRTALHHCMFSNGSEKVVKHILQDGDEIEIDDEDGDSPYHLGAKNETGTKERFVLTVLEKKLFLIQNNQ